MLWTVIFLSLSQDVELADLTIIATLGVGGFGRVELVKVGAETVYSIGLQALPHLRHY